MLRTRRFVYISDRDKGAEQAEEELGDKVVRALYCRHLEQNFTTKFDKGLRSLFWNVARARTQYIYDKCMTEIADNKPAAANYLRDIVSLILTNTR